MTEEDAKKRWCPFKGARAATGLDHQQCVGSLCMAWRDLRGPSPETKGTPLNGRPFVVLGGYCGLAGRP